MQTLTTLTFEVKRFVPAGRSIQDDMKSFIELHEHERHRVLVLVDPTGIGDAVIDRLRISGFAVVESKA